MGTLQEDKAALFQSDVYRGPTRDLELGGVKLEIRAPKVRHTIKNLSKKNAKVKISGQADFRKLLLECVFHKESGQLFFTEEDLEALEEAAGHENGILAQIGDAIGDLSQDIADTTTDEQVKN